MPSARPITFPLESMAEDQRQVFHRYLAARRKSGIHLHGPIWFALLLSRERPAMELISLSHRGLSDPPPTTNEEVAETFDLVYRSETDHSLTVARTSWRLDILPSHGEDSDAYHRRQGRFFGYPEVDIDYFINREEARTPPEDLVAQGVFQPEEIAFTTFVPQGYDDSITGYERAIEIGKNNRSTIGTLSHNWDVPALDAYAEWLYQDALTDCLTKSEK